MAAGRPIDDHDRQQVRALHAEGLSRNAIAKKIGRSYATVTKIANELGLTFDRRQTAEATRVRVVDAKARRAQLASNLLDDAIRLREQLWKPCTIHNFGGRDNTHNSVDIERPLFRDQLAIVQAAGLAAERHARLVELDADQGTEDAKSMLTDLMGALGQAWRDGQADAEQP